MKISRNRKILSLQKIILIAVGLLTHPFALGVFHSDKDIENGIEEHKVCINKTVNEAGEHICMGYYLPYRNQTLDDYHRAISNKLSERQKNESIERIDLYRDYIIKDLENFIPVGDDLKTGQFCHLSIFEIALILVSPVDAVEEHVYMLLTLLRNHGMRLYPETKADDLNRIAHDLYAISQGYYLEKIPDFDFATQNAGYKALLTDSFDIYSSTKLVPVDASITKVLTGRLFHAVHAFSCAPLHWNSLESTRNLLSLVPELKDYPVLQLDSGSGALANMLKMEGVDIVTAEIECTKHCENSSHFHGYTGINQEYYNSWEEVFNKYLPERKLFLFDNVTADRVSDLEYLRMTNKGTIVVLLARQSFPIEKFSSDFHIKRIPGNKAFKPSLHKYENGDDVDILILRKRKPFHDEL